MSDTSISRAVLEHQLDIAMQDNNRLRQAEPLFIAAMEACGISEAAQGAVMACWRAKMDTSVKGSEGKE